MGIYWSSIPISIKFLFQFAFAAVSLAIIPLVFLMRRSVATEDELAMDVDLGTRRQGRALRADQHVGEIELEIAVDVHDVLTA